MAIFSLVSFFVIRFFSFYRLKTHSISQIHIFNSEKNPVSPVQTKAAYNLTSSMIIKQIFPKRKPTPCGPSFPCWKVYSKCCIFLNGRILISSLTHKELNALQQTTVGKVCKDVIVPWWYQGDSFTQDFFGVPGWTFLGNSFFPHITKLCNSLSHDLFNRLRVVS